MRHGCCQRAGLRTKPSRRNLRQSLCLHLKRLQVRLGVIASLTLFLAAPSMISTFAFANGFPQRDGNVRSRSPCISEPTRHPAADPPHGEQLVRHANSAAPLLLTPGGGTAHFRHAGSRSSQTEGQEPAAPGTDVLGDAAAPPPGAAPPAAPAALRTPAGQRVGAEPP